MPKQTGKIDYYASCDLQGALQLEVYAHASWVNGEVTITAYIQIDGQRQQKTHTLTPNEDDRVSVDGGKTSEGLGSLVAMLTSGLVQDSPTDRYEIEHRECLLTVVGSSSKLRITVNHSTRMLPIMTLSLLAAAGALSEEMNDRVEFNGLSPSEWRIVSDLSD